MLSTITLKTLKERKLSTLIYSAGLFVFALMFTALHEDFAREIDNFADSFPDTISAFVGDISAAASPEGWLAIELYGLFLPIILAIIGVGFGASAIGKEEKSGTLELLLASPVSRSSIFVQKSLAIVLQLAIVSTAVWLGVALGSLLFTFDVSLVKVFWASLSGLLMGLVFGSVALATQAITGKRSIGIGLGSGVVAVTYIASVVSQLVESLSFLRYFSPFHYYDESTVIQQGPGGYMLVLVGTIIILYIVAHVAFTRRDTGV